MTKQEFLDGLCAALNVSGSQKLINDNRIFYDDYITKEVAKGKTETEVTAELGEPRLIANSILQAGGYKDLFAEGTKTYTAYDTPDGDPTTFAQGREYKGRSFEEQKEYEEKQAKREQKVKKAGMSLKTILTIVLIVAVIGVILYLAVRTIGGILQVFGPILIPVLLIITFVNLIRRFKE